MDVVTGHGAVSDESSCGDSSGPTTPVYSPLMHPLVMKSGTDTPMEALFDLEKRSSLTTFSMSSESVASEARSERLAIQSVCFVGAGYVGGPTAAVVALHNPGIRVVVVDKDERRIKQWRSKHLPIHEPGLHDIVRICRDGAKVKSNADLQTEDGQPVSSWDRQPNLFFSTDVSGSIATSEVVFLAVNTSTKTFGVGAGRATDMSACDAATRDIAAHARPGTIIVEKSTVPCGTAQRISRTLSSLRPGDPFEILSNPEFLAEGSAIQDLLNPDRVIIGSFPTSSGRAACESLAGLYSAWVSQDRILTSNVWSSELSKLVANAMLAQRISSINSISAICEETGADIDEIARAIGQDSRIGSKFLKAGLGFGGSCFRKDIASLTYLAESLGLDDVAEYWSQVNQMNQFQHRRFTQKVIRRLGQNLVGKKIAILGFAFKANTGDPRESLAAEVIKDLLVERPAQIAIFDPFCNEADILREVQSSETTNRSAITVCSSPYAACHDADAVLVATDCDQFKSHEQWNQKRLVEKLSPFRSAEEGIVIQHGSIHAQYNMGFQPACTSDCQSCILADQNPTQNAGHHPEPLNWSTIVSNLKTPRWIFDGRNVLNVDEIKSLDPNVNIECIGKTRYQGLNNCI